MLNNLGISYRRRFQHTRDMQDLSEAIRRLQRAVQLTPNGHPAFLSNLGNSLSRRFECTGDMRDVSEAIRHQQHAVQLTQNGDPDLPARLNNLGNSFSRRFEQTGDMQDILEALRHQQHAVKLTPNGDPDLPDWLVSLGISFSCRFRRTGDIQDISEAIRHQQHAVQSTPKGDPDLPSRLVSLGTSFLSRFEQTEDMRDISEAIQYQQQAVQLTPNGHADFPARLNNLGNSFSRRFQSAGDIQDVSQAIQHQQHAVQLTPSGHATLPGRLNNLGASFLGRFVLIGDVHDISQAIRHQQHAVQLTPNGRANFPMLLNNLGVSYFHRFECTSDVQDLSEAIRYQQHAIQLTPDGHPSLPARLFCLGDSFSHRFKLTGMYESLSSAVLNYRLSATSPTGPSACRLIAAKRWATLSQQLLSPSSELLKANSCIIQLLSLISGFENTVQRRHETLVDASQLSLAACATALSLDHPDQALEWLVEGRCIVWNQINQLRTPLDELRSHDPALAEGLSVLSKALESAGLHTSSHKKQLELSMDDRVSLEDEARIRLKLAKDWEMLLETVRTIPRFRNFLRPRKCADIMSSLPDEGPVIIVNIHSIRCDALALIAGADEPIHISLPNFSYQEAERLANGSRSYLGARSRLGILLDDDNSSHFNTNIDFPMVLKVLWSDIVNPILQALAFSVRLPAFVRS